MKNKLKIAFLGFGSQAANVHALYIARHCYEQVEIVAIYDVLPEDLPYAEERVRFLGISVTPVAIDHGDPSDPKNIHSATKMLSRYPDIDGVIVSTPHAKHYLQAKFCLSNGINVLVDKPMTLRYSEAAELVTLARSNGLCYVIASQRRYENSYSYAKDIISSGKIGQVKSVNACISQPGDWIRGWRLDWGLSGGGALCDLGWHVLDILCFLLDPLVTTVFATSDGQAHDRVERQCAALLVAEDGMAITLDVNHLAPHDAVYERLHLSGTGGTLILERHKPKRDMEQPVILHQDIRGTIVRDGIEIGVAMKWAPCKAFVDFLLRNDAPRPHTDLRSAGIDSLETMRLVEAIYQSAEKKQLIYL